MGRAAITGITNVQVMGTKRTATHKDLMSIIRGRLGAGTEGVGNDNFSCVAYERLLGKLVPLI